jgi:hypothetical protein
VGTDVASDQGSLRLQRNLTQVIGNNGYDIGHLFEEPAVVEMQDVLVAYVSILL